MQALQPFFADHQAAMLDTLAALVAEETPSGDKPRLDAFVARLRERWLAVGNATLLPEATQGEHLLLNIAGPPNTAHALMVCHYDTVWPVGTLARMPWRRDGGRISGPGVYDMKASLVIAEWALRAITALGLALPRPVQVVVTSDEEIGSPTGRAVIERAAQGAAYALVLEPPLVGGALKTARKAAGRFTLEVSGRASHAGLAPEEGRSAIVELAHHILRLHQLQSPAHGTTINTGVIQGGTRPNVVAAQARMDIDVRAWSQAEAERIVAAIRATTAITPDVTIMVTGELSRPPMERTTAIADLFARAHKIGATLGLALTEGAAGGVSDANFTAALGLPTLDGLGVEGDGAHAAHEHILLGSLSERAALLAALLIEL